MVTFNNDGLDQEKNMLQGYCQNTKPNFVKQLTLWEVIKRWQAKTATNKNGDSEMATN